MPPYDHISKWDIPGCLHVLSPEYPEGLRTWTPNRCANIYLGKFILRPEHVALFSEGFFPNGLKAGYCYPISIHPVRVVFWMPKPVPQTLVGGGSVALPSSMYGEDGNPIVGPDWIESGDWNPPGSGGKGSISPEFPEIGPAPEWIVFEACRMHIGRTALVHNAKTSVFANRWRAYNISEDEVCLGHSFIYTGDAQGADLPGELGEVLRRGYRYSLSAYKTPEHFEMHMRSTRHRCGMPV